MKKVIVHEELCKACGLCVHYCKDHALCFKDTLNAKGVRPVQWKGTCSLCGRCYLVCPDTAIEVLHETVER